MGKLFDRLANLFKSEPAPVAEIPAPFKCSFCKQGTHELFKPTLIIWPEDVPGLARFPVRVTFGASACKKCRESLEWISLADDGVLTTAHTAFARKGFRAIATHLTAIHWEPIGSDV